MMLVVAAGLFVQTFERLAHAPLGMDRDRVLLATIAAPTVPPADRSALYYRLVGAAAAVPGVAHAGGTLNPPIAGTLVGDLVVTEPGVAPRADAEVVTQSTSITSGALAAFGTPVQSGRDFDDRDTTTSPKVILVNDALARRFFPGRNMVGASVALTFRSGPGGDIPLAPTPWSALPRTPPIVPFARRGGRRSTCRCPSVAIRSSSTISSSRCALPVARRPC
jgi:putative ABC transport system permease protein